MYKFMGVLIGNAFRSKSCMPFNLVPMIWKQLCDIQPNENDLQSIDAYTWQTFKAFRKLAKKHKDPAEFEIATSEQTFTVSINGKEIPLCDDGESKTVSHDNLEEWIKMT